MGAASSTRGRLAIGAGLVAAIAAFAYAQVLTFDFAYDDHWTIVQNPSLDGRLGDLLRTLAGGRGPEARVPDATRPAMVASVWLDRRLWGAWAGGYHLQSLLLYALVCVLAGLAAFALARRTRVALVAAVFFALAPVHAEVVAAINYREDLLAAAGLLVPLAWLFWPRRKAETPFQSALVALAWGVGLLGKESAVGLVLVVPAVIAILRPTRSWWATRERTLFSLGGVLLVWGNWRAALFISGDDIPRAAPMDAVARLWSTARFEVRAVIEAVVPVSWSPEYVREAPASGAWMLAWIALIVGTVLLARRRSTRPLALGLAIAMLAPLATSPLIGPVNPRADRYLFLSVLGGGLVWGWIADRLAGRIPRRLRWATLALATVPLALITQRAAAPWRTDRELWTAATERAPTAPRAWTGLSRAYRLDERLDDADQAIARAIELDPDFMPARVTKTYAHLARGDTEAATEEIDRIRRMRPGPHRGLPRAARCAKLSPEEAKACIRPRWR